MFQGHPHLTKTGSSSGDNNGGVGIVQSEGEDLRTKVRIVTQISKVTMVIVENEIHSMYNQSYNNEVLSEQKLGNPRNLFNL